MKHLKTFESFNYSPYRLINENGEYIKQIKELILSFDEDNIKLAFQIAKGLKIKQIDILEEYRDLFTAFGYKPSVTSLLKIIGTYNLDCKSATVPDILFKLPNLEKITFYKIVNLDNLVEFDGDINIWTTYGGGGQGTITSLPSLKKIGGSLDILFSLINSIPQLEYVGGSLNLMGKTIKSFSKLTAVGGNLYMSNAKIESLGSLTTVGGNLSLSHAKIDSLGSLTTVGGDLSLRNTPLSETAEEEIRNKVDVKGKIFLYGY